MFEYKFLAMVYDVENEEYTKESDFNALGEDNWELVAVWNSPDGDDVAIFKRMV